MGGGNLASKSKKKGFAISGILYPLLILTLFLVVQILFMMQTRKNVLDKSKKELADSVNASNIIYNNEELSTLIQSQKDLIDKQEKKINSLEDNLAIYKTNFDKFKLAQESVNVTAPIGTYDLFLGDAQIKSSTYGIFGMAYNVKAYMYDALGYTPTRNVKVCVVGSTNSRGATYNEYSYVKIKYAAGKEKEMVFNTWGNVNSGTSETRCTDINKDFLNAPQNQHWEFFARTNDGLSTIRIYRIYLITYMA